MKLKAYVGVGVFLVTAIPSQAEITGEPLRSPPARHFVCDKGYTLKQCDEEMVVLKKALAKYPIPDLGEWTWVLVRSEYWKLSLLTQTLDPGIPALTDTAARATFLDDALVTGESGRMSELMALWHMGRENLLDFAIRHELGHALCNNANEMDADRVARLLEQKKPISCRAKAKRDRRKEVPTVPILERRRLPRTALKKRASLVVERGASSSPKRQPVSWCGFPDRPHFYKTLRSN